MRHSIVEKLERRLSKGLESEAEIVYILVEIRKVLKDHDAESTNYSMLLFFSDWVVHAKLDRRSARKMLDTVQDFYRGLGSYLGMSRSSFSPFTWLIVLRIELEKFLEENNLPAALTTESKHWRDFVFLLIDVIEDSPLEQSTGYIRAFSFKEYSSKEHIRCELTLEDGSVQKFESRSTSDFIVG